MVTKKLFYYCMAVFTAFAMVICHPAAAQESSGGGGTSLGLSIFPAADSVYLISRGLPTDGVAGFVVYRADAGSSDFQRLNNEPVKPIYDSAAILELLGGEAADMLEGLEIESVDVLFDDYKKRKSMYNLFTIFSLDMNRILGRLYVDEDVEPGATYRYKIALVDASGKETQTFDPQDIVVQPAKINAPEGFELEAGDGTVALKWNVPGEDFMGIGWDIERAESPDGPFENANRKLVSILGEGEDKEHKAFHDTLLENGKTYYYRVVGKDLVGNSSPPSETLEATPVDMTPPMPPKDVKVALTDDGARVTWAMNLEPDVANYNIFKGDTQEGDFTQMNEEPLEPDVTFFDDPDTEEGKIGYYKLTATDKTGNVSNDSAPVSIIPPDKTPPASPIQVAGAPGGESSILITWEENQEEDLQGYYVFRGDDQDNLQRINEGVVDKGIGQYEDFTVRPGHTYYYSVAALDDNLNVSERSTVIKVVAPDNVPPRFPASLAAQPDDGKVTLAWPPNRDADLAGYRLYRTDKEGAAPEEFKRAGEDISKDVSEYVDESVKNGVKYWYYLTAFDTSENESETSDTVDALPQDFTPPVQPEGLAIEATEEELILTWTPNPEKDVAGYEVLRSEIQTGVFKPVNGEELLPPDAAEFVDDTLAEGDEFWYRVVAVDTSGNKSRRSEAAGPGALVVPEPEPEEGAAEGGDEGTGEEGPVENQDEKE